jgi:hypothetical protein
MQKIAAELAHFTAVAFAGTAYAPVAADWHGVSNTLSAHISTRLWYALYLHFLFFSLDCD